MPVNVEVLKGVGKFLPRFYIDSKKILSVYGDFIIVCKMGIGYQGADFCGLAEIRQ